MMLVYYFSVIERYIGIHLRSFFEWLQGDMESNMSLIFIAGLFSGGMIGSNMQAFGTTFGVSMLGCKYESRFMAGYFSYLWLEAMYIESPAIISWAHAGHIVHDILYTQIMTPLKASALTMATVNIY